MRKALAGIFVATALVLSGCGADEPDETFSPAAYGNDDTEQCYYIEDPAEVELLKEDGLCEQDWVATPAPEDYVASYYPFFFFVGGDSDRHHYRNRYVPKSKHSAYSTKFKALQANPTFQSKVSTLSPKAPYKSSKGGTIVTGSKVKSNQFGGSRVSGGGGFRKCASGVLTVDLAVLAKGGGGSRGGGGGGSRGGSSGGGSNKGGGSVNKGGGSAPKAPARVGGC